MKLWNVGSRRRFCNNISLQGQNAAACWKLFSLTVNEINVSLKFQFHLVCQFNFSPIFSCRICIQYQSVNWSSEYE